MQPDLRSNEAKRAAVEAALGAPAGCELSDETLRIRRNLLIAGLAAIGTVLTGATIKPDSTILGLQFTGLTDQIIQTGLLATLIYLLFHFLWCAADSFQTWRIRLTGTRTAFITAARIGDDDADYPSDPKMTSLYWWWTEHSSKLLYLNDRIKKLAATADAIHQATTETGEVREQVLLDFKNEIRNYVSAAEAANNILGSQRIPVSLEHFDKSFYLLLRSQNLRWLVFDILIPVCIGGYGIFLLANKVSL